METSSDEYEALFISIIPSVRKMSEEDKFDFRINLMQLIKNINRRTSYSPALTSSTSRSTSSSSSTSFSYHPSPFSVYPSNSQESNAFLNSQQELTQQTYNFEVGQQQLIQPT